MIDLTGQEKSAMRAAIRRVADTTAEVGWGTRVRELNEALGLTFIEARRWRLPGTMQAIARQDMAPEVAFGCAIARRPRSTSTPPSILRRAFEA